MGRIFCDGMLEKDIQEIMDNLRRKGFKNIKKPDVIRLLVGKYKEERSKVKLKRKPKSKKWSLI